jgi:translation initiation factor IF-2
VVKKDVMKASIMLEHESQYATILAFDVKVERDAQELADTLGVKIFQADIIYHLFDKFMAYREELKQKKREEFKHIAVFPCKLKILPQFIFNSRDPIVVGVMVEAGIVKEGTPICVPNKEVSPHRSSISLRNLGFSRRSVRRFGRGDQHRNQPQNGGKRQERSGGLHQNRAGSR